MEAILLVVHLLVAIALVAVVLLQRSEGGALGIGGGPGGLMSSRGAANLLTKTTSWLAAGFIICALALAILAKQKVGERSVFDDAPELEDGVLPPLPADQLAPEDEDGEPAAPIRN